MIFDSSIIFAVLGVCIIALATDLFCLRRKMRKLLKGKNCDDLGSALNARDKELDDLKKFREEMTTYLQTVEKRVRRSVQAAETVRFNAFRGDGLGGNQSFATAFVNEEGDGAVLSSLYSRDRVSVFSKPIAKFDSEIELSEEERRAVSLAQDKVRSKETRIK